MEVIDGRVLLDHNTIRNVVGIRVRNKDASIQLFCCADKQDGSVAPRLMKLDSDDRHLLSVADAVRDVIFILEVVTGSRFVLHERSDEQYTWWWRVDRDDFGLPK